MDEVRILKIEYYTGYSKGRMSICLDNFLPCTLKKLKQLRDVIKMDLLHREALIDTLKTYIQNEILELESVFKERAKDYFKYKQLKSDTQQAIENKKHPNGVKLSDDELKEFNKNLKSYTQRCNSALRDTKKIEKHQIKFKSLLKEIDRW
jgi:uncharacterized protein (DUF4415 family)